MVDLQLWRWIGGGAIVLLAPIAAAQDAPPEPAGADPAAGELEQADPQTDPQAEPLTPAEQADAIEAEQRADQLERAAHARQEQFAAAAHLAEELDRTLTEQGLIPQRNDYRNRPPAQGEAGSDDSASPAEQRAKLTELATRAGLLLRSTALPSARFTLLQTQARIYNALAQDAATRGEELDTTRRLRQLRSAGQALRQVDRADAAATGAYWVLLADLADTNRADAPVEARQGLAREVLAAYIDEFEEDRVGADFVIDARLALARLLDQAGDQPGVANQLQAIGTLDRADPRRRELDLLHASTARIGRAVELDLTTTRGLRWKLSEQGGEPVLLHIFADGSVGNAEMIQGLMEKIARFPHGGYRVVSLRVGPEVKGGARSTWPTLVATGQQRAVLEQFGVVSAPTLIWLDRQGRIAAVGQTLDVFDQIPLGQADPFDKEDRAREQDQPAPDPEQHAEPAAPLAPIEPGE